MEGRPQILLTIRRLPSTRRRRLSLPGQARDRSLGPPKPFDVRLQRRPGAAGFGFSLIPTSHASSNSLIEIVGEFALSCPS